MAFVRIRFDDKDEAEEFTQDQWRRVVERVPVSSPLVMCFGPTAHFLQSDVCAFPSRDFHLLRRHILFEDFLSEDDNVDQSAGWWPRDYGQAMLLWHEMDRWQIPVPQDLFWRFPNECGAKVDSVSFHKPSSSYDCVSTHILYYEYIKKGHVLAIDQLPFDDMQLKRTIFECQDECVVATQCFFNRQFVVVVLTLGHPKNQTVLYWKLNRDGHDSDQHHLIDRGPFVLPIDGLFEFTTSRLAFFPKRVLVRHLGDDHHLADPTPHPKWFHLTGFELEPDASGRYPIEMVPLTNQLIKAWSPQWEWYFGELYCGHIFGVTMDSVHFYDGASGESLGEVRIHNFEGELPENNHHRLYVCTSQKPETTDIIIMHTSWNRTKGYHVGMSIVDPLTQQKKFDDCRQDGQLPADTQHCDFYADCIIQAQSAFLIWVMMKIDRNVDHANCSSTSDSSSDDDDDDDDEEHQETRILIFECLLSKGIRFLYQTNVEQLAGPTVRGLSTPERLTPILDGRQLLLINRKGRFVILSPQSDRPSFGPDFITNATQR